MLNADSLSKLADKVEIPLERIKRDRWVQKAKQAHFRKYKERI